MDAFAAIRQALIDDEANASMTALGWQPLFAASAAARIVIVGQAPGHKAQSSGVPWNDASGNRLKSWLGVTEEQFRSELVAHVPMDFYFPGTGRSGDLPPRRGFAARWHPQLLALMPSVELTVLVGKYAQAHYLGSSVLTPTVRAFESYLPSQIPIVHPSPLNHGWHNRNPWFVEDVVPALQARVREVLNLSDPAAARS